MFRLYRFLHIIFQVPLAALGLPPHSCRFTPSCSRYCETAVHRFGVVRGGSLCVRRIVRCRPGVPPGIDPVPNK